MATKLQDSLVRKIQENRELKDTIKDLHAQSERDKEFYQQQLQQFKNDAVELEVAIKKCILLENKVEQLKDDINKYSELYYTTKIVAQSLGLAVYYLTKEKQHG
jgi:hypothetical protein